MIKQWTQCICDYCGESDYYKTFGHAQCFGWVRRIVRCKAQHFCNEAHALAYIEKELK